MSIGLGVLAMAKIILGEQLKVVISDLVPYRLKLAERLVGLQINVAKGLAQGRVYSRMDWIESTWRSTLAGDKPLVRKALIC